MSSSLQREDILTELILRLILSEKYKEALSELDLSVFVYLPRALP